MALPTRTVTRALAGASLAAAALCAALPSVAEAQGRPSTRRARGSGVPVEKDRRASADTAGRAGCRCDTVAVAVDTAALERALRTRLTAELEARARDERAQREQALRRLVDSVNTAYVDAVRRRDVEAATTLYAPEAVMYPPGQRPIDGREAIRARLAAWLPSATLQDARLTTEEVFGDDDDVVASGRYTYAVRDGRRARTDAGTWLMAWRRQADGSWRIVRDVMDSDGGGR